MSIITTPYVPTNITVHLGPPDSSAENVTVPFRDYIKNVASSEVYPTWHPAALRANILAQVSFALNRIYTEFYPSRGYDFNITSSTAYDQKFINGRNIFDSISELVDDLFNDYLRRQGHIEPLAAGFCNGTTSTCNGLSQWGSEFLAQQGQNSVEIVRHYYGNDVEIVVDAPEQDIHYSYPGTPLREVDISPEVQVAQVMLNRIAVAYPAIPQVQPVNGVFSSNMTASVQEFQRIFNLTPDGIIGKATWYTMVSLYTGILRLSELASQGQTFYALGLSYQNNIAYGQQGEIVSLLQYLLAMLGEFYLSIPTVSIDGVFGSETYDAVRALQKDAGLEETGVVDEATWNVLVDRFLSIDRTVLSNPAFFPYESSSGEVTPAVLYDYFAQNMGHFPGIPLELGSTDRERSGV